MNRVWYVVGIGAAFTLGKIIGDCFEWWFLLRGVE